jgi:small subunit ribosomal protein S16
MVTIRMARGGAKKKPFYSIVVTDSRKRRDSGYIERIGYFNPVARGNEVRLHLEEDKLVAWQGKGAKLSDRVKQLVKEFKDPSIREKAAAATTAKLKAIADKKDAEQKAKLEAEAKAAKEEADAKIAEEKAAAEAAAAEASAESSEAEATEEATAE